MDKEFVKATLLELAPALKAAGITHIALHGSVVRGEGRWDSDVDLLIRPQGGRLQPDNVSVTPLDSARDAAFGAL